MCTDVMGAPANIGRVKGCRAVEEKRYNVGIFTGVADLFSSEIFPTVVLLCCLYLFLPVVMLRSISVFQ